MKKKMTRVIKCETVSGKDAYLAKKSWNALEYDMSKTMIDLLGTRRKLAECLFFDELKRNSKSNAKRQVKF